MPSGGKRKGAGRPPGQGRYGEPTRPVRVPVSLLPKVEQALRSGAFKIPLYGNKVAAGFPSPADDFIETRLDANDLVVDNPTATFFLRVVGDSMSEAGIYSGDYIAVDRSLEPKPGKIVVAAVDGEFTVKYLVRAGKKLVLRAAHPDYDDIIPEEGEEMRFFGVVCGVIRRLD